MKVFGAAQSLFAGEKNQVVTPPEGGVEAAGAAGEVLAHYVMMCGQRLAYYFRNALRNLQPKEHPPFRRVELT